MAISVNLIAENKGAKSSIEHERQHDKEHTQQNRQEEQLVRYDFWHGLVESLRFDLVNEWERQKDLHWDQNGNYADARVEVLDVGHEENVCKNDKNYVHSQSDCPQWLNLACCSNAWL